MTLHLLIVQLAFIAGMVFIMSKFIDHSMPLDDGDPADDDDDEPYESHPTDDDPEHDHSPVSCSSMAEARAVAEHDLPAGAYVEMHSGECAKRQQGECDCDVEAWTVTEKAEA